MRGFARPSGWTTHPKTLGGRQELGNVQRIGRWSEIDWDQRDVHILPMGLTIVVRIYANVIRLLHVHF